MSGKSFFSAHIFRAKALTKMYGFATLYQTKDSILPEI